MQWLIGGLSAFVGWLCRVFGVTPKEVAEAREKNPSPSRES